VTNLKISPRSQVHSPMSAIPDKVLSLAEAVRSEGGRALLVGGCVRDELMDRQPKDWDVEIYGIAPARLRELLDSLGEVNVVGEAFTVYKLGPHLDISLPRRERKTGRGHRAFFIEGDPEMEIEEAVARRDFTINAILQDPLTGEIIDPFHGRDDLQGGILRAVHRIRLARTACASCARPSLPPGSSLESSPKPQFSVAQSIFPTCRASGFGARWKSYSCARNVPRSGWVGSTLWACSISFFRKSKRSSMFRRIPSGTRKVMSLSIRGW